MVFCRFGCVSKKVSDYWFLALEGGQQESAAVAAAAAAAISSHQQQQQSKLDSIGLDFEQDKRGYKRGYERISSRISEGTFRPPGTCYCD